MKKSTILILLVIYLGSVLIVGVFGLKAVPFEEVVYCKQIVPTAVTSNKDQKYQIKSNDEGYYIVAPYEEGIMLMIEYQLQPADCTSKDIRMEITYPYQNPPATISEHGEIEFSRMGAVCIRYSATDAPTAPSIEIWIYWYQPEL